MEGVYLFIFLFKVNDELDDIQIQAKLIVAITALKLSYEIKLY